MEAALRLARAAAVREEIPVGCVIVHEGDTIRVERAGEHLRFVRAAPAAERASA
jgi:tRNA(Arg) A34 adenosine deaminase TadA